MPSPKITTQHIPVQDNNSLPSSPTDSTTSSFIASIAEKSASELGCLLKNAYKSIKEKEQDLLLAAKFGSTLLEQNKNLKSDYEKLLQNVKSLEIETNHGQIKKTYDNMVDSLERKNTEMQSALEQAQQQANLINQINSQKQRKLENEVSILKGSLDMATKKVQELEEHNQLQKERFRKLGQDQRHQEDLLLLQELTIKMEELFVENKHLQTSKKSIEEKLSRSLRDLEHLRQEFEQLELTQQSYESLKVTFETQSKHISELNESLEDYRFTLSKLRDKGLWSPQHSPTPSVYQPTCLLNELENAWPSNFLTFCNPPADYAIDRLLSSINNKDYELFEPEGSGSVYSEFNLYPTIPEKKHKDMPKKGFFNQIMYQLHSLLRSLLGWCRFAIILTAAIFINLWRGPRLFL